MDKDTIVDCVTIAIAFFTFFLFLFLYGCAGHPDAYHRTNYRSSVGMSAEELERETNRGVSGYPYVRLNRPWPKSLERLTNH